MLILGIDPGLTGAMALLDADGVPELVTDLPVIRDRKLAWIDGAALQTLLRNALRGRSCRAIVERVFSTLREWFEEFNLYHRKEGLIVKENDDLISATRYAMMMRRFGAPAHQTVQTPAAYVHRPGPQGPHAWMYR